MPPVSRSYELFGNVLTFRALPSEGAPYLLAECQTAPGAGAPVNSHAGDEESFYVLSGRYVFDIGGVEREAGPGEHVAIPTGAPHAFRNAGADVAVMLILNWPGRVHEAFFSTLGRPVEPGTRPVAGDGPPPAEAQAEMRRIGLTLGVDLAV
jgi:mannose-6-phosphate isomerase-like protein (cupin superfamily)